MAIPPPCALNAFVDKGYRGDDLLIVGDNTNNGIDNTNNGIDTFSAFSFFGTNTNFSSLYNKECFLNLMGINDLSGFLISTTLSTKVYSFVWMLMSTVWILMSKSWMLMSNVWMLMSKSWMLMSNVWMLVSKSWMLMSNVWMLMNNVWMNVSKSWMLVSKSWKGYEGEFQISNYEFQIG